MPIQLGALTPFTVMDVLGAQPEIHGATVAAIASVATIAFLFAPFLPVENPPQPYLAVSSIECVGDSKAPKHLKVTFKWDFDKLMCGKIECEKALRQLREILFDILPTT